MDRSCLLGQVLMEDVEQGRPVGELLELPVKSSRLCKGLEVKIERGICDIRLLLVQVAVPMCQPFLEQLVIEGEEDFRQVAF